MNVCWSMAKGDPASEDPLLDDGHSDDDIDIAEEVEAEFDKDGDEPSDTPDDTADGHDEGRADRLDDDVRRTARTPGRK